MACERRRVVVDVEPRILADTLILALEDAELAVVLHTDASDDHDDRTGAQVAIVTGPRARRPAEVVIELSEEPTDHTAIVHGPGQRSSKAWVRDLHAVLHLVDTCLRELERPHGDEPPHG